MIYEANNKFPTLCAQDMKQKWLEEQVVVVENEFNMKKLAR
jgi:hypothetical protein